ncbi:uncharacterized protein ACN427_000659 isoform 3-T3 [Glossina fuscipes fuscipes]
MSVVPIQRKPSNETLCTIGTDSTLDSRMSSTDVPQMELLKINYVHQCKEAFMPKIETISNYKYMDFKSPPLIHSNASNIARISINRSVAPNKPLPPAPPPTIESWQFLQNSKSFSNPTTIMKDKVSSSCRQETGCEVNDEAATDGQTQIGDGIKSNSWNYHNKISTCDIKRNIVKAGIKSRANRIANIEKTECEHRQASLSSPPAVLAIKKINEMFEIQKQKLLKDIPPQPQRWAPLPQKEPNRRLRVCSPGVSLGSEEFVKRINSPKFQLNCSECLCNNEKIYDCLGNVSPLLQMSSIPKILPAKNRKQINDQFTEQEKNEENAVNCLTFKKPDKKADNESSPDSLPIDARIFRNTRIMIGNYHKSKVERIHLRKKRQPLLIINQANGDEPEEQTHVESKQTPLIVGNENECNKLKRLSLESNSDSGVSSVHDHKEIELNEVSNLKTVDECSDCIKFNYEDEQSQYGLTKSEHINQSSLCNSKTTSIMANNVDEEKFFSKTYGSQIKIEVRKSCDNPETDFSCLMPADPNDLQNFSNKNLTKPTTAEALNSSITRLTLTKPFKQCNIENEQRLKFNNTWRSDCSSYGTTSICIEEDWKRHDKWQQKNDEDFIETDSLIINEQLTERKPINCDDNCVKIFVRSSVECNNSCRASCKSANSFISQTSIRTNSSAKASVCSDSSASSASLTSSSVCFSSSIGNQSICDSRSACFCTYSKRSVSSLSENNRNSSCSPISSTNFATDVMSEISCVTCNQEQKQERLQPTITAVCPPINFETTCCNAADGVFWNSSYFVNNHHRQHSDYEENEENANCCCCSLSSCDDDCSLYEEETECNGNCTNATNRKNIHPIDYVQLRSGPFKIDTISANIANGRNKRNSSAEEILIRNRKFPWKTDVIHELRPRSMDGIVDAGISLNGDNTCNMDNGDHIQNQQDLDARRLKRGHVLTELLETERIYVHEMSSILKGYCDQMHSEEMIHLVPASLQGKEDILFGNLHELYTFHNEVFLKDLENCISTTELVALCFVQRRDTFYRLYSFYCQNIPRSERLRETLVDTHLFLQECQKRLGHKLPLAAYLLKPVQRITKYQLLLKDLLRFSDSGSCTKELQKALDCMLIVLKCVNDSMHQVAITGFPTDLAQQGELLLQDSFQVWSESKRDIRLRIKPQQRHIFLYQKSMLFCKQTSKPGHNKSTYQFKHYLKMSQIGLTESVRGDNRRFEVWLQGRQEVHTLQAPTIEIKNKWVAEIKRVLLNQLEELKGEKIKQYGLSHRGLRQTTSWDTPNILLGATQRTVSCDASSESSNRNSNCSSSDDNCISSAIISANSLTTTNNSTGDKDHNEACGWSSDYSNSEDEMSTIEDNSTPHPGLSVIIVLLLLQLLQKHVTIKTKTITTITTTVVLHIHARINPIPNSMYPLSTKFAVPAKLTNGVQLSFNQRILNI